MAKNYKNSTKYKQIRASLIQQLEENGNATDFYIDLVNDYMALWCVKMMLIDDIEERGVSCLYQNGANQFGYKKNDSVAELNRTNLTMTKLLVQLGIKAKVITTTEENDDEL